LKAAPKNQSDLFASSPLSVAQANADKFPDDFLEWLPDNLHIFRTFSAEAIKIKNRGYSHYSSYTIVEFMRHHTAITEKNGEFKINNNHRPYLARLFDLFYPQHAGLFEYRITKKVHTAEELIGS
jgi:hypothetical protein